MPAAPAQPHLRRLFYFKAPAVSRLSPSATPPDVEVIEIVTEGVVYFRSDGSDRKLGCGAMFWHVAGEETIHRTEASSPYECLALAFTVPPRRQRPAPRLSIVADHQRIREFCAELLRSYHDEAVSRKALESYAYSRCLWEAHLVRTRRPQKTRPPAIEAALAYVESAFREPGLGVREIAAAAGLSEPHIHVLFRQHVAQPPHQFLTARRMREAKRLLTSTNFTIKSIATDCGFLNIETFYRTFKRMIGTTPFEFRSRHSSPFLADIWTSP